MYVTNSSSKCQPLLRSFEKSKVKIAGHVNLRHTCTHGGYQPGKLGKVRVFESGPGKVRKNSRSRENVFLRVCCSAIDTR